MKKIKAQQQGVKIPKILVGLKGFSAVELVVVIAIVGILAAIAIPTFLAWSPGIKLKSAARDLYSNLQRARMLALKNNQDVSVRFVDGATNDFLFFDTINPDASPPVLVPDPGEYIFNITNYGYSIAFGKGTAVNNWNGNAIGGLAPGVLTFNNRGTANQGTVYLENENQDICYAVTVIRTGSIKLRKYSDPGWN